ncbi:hypothetical protein CYMTET_24536 [Cymbomonas tetramitiformis]|uniref:Uncharacterized protein n=1 Tax=Cymbomonas tetramitiformis TaxID=36881 RepID=A0AAE0FVZ5_9CHLO|nr:hypothetical protein CYMTET_24536 [Cymbomonas tetramitiformis]
MRLNQEKGRSLSYTYLRWGIQSFANFVPKTVVQRIVKGDKRAAHLYVDEAEVTIFFSGITNFASIKEAIGLECVMLLMEEYLTCMSQIIEEEGGVIGDFIDDGAPSSVRSSFQVLFKPLGAGLLDSHERVLLR